MNIISEIFKNNSNIAFIIGNGINHRFFENQVPSWNSLISDISIVFADIKYPEAVQLKCPKCKAVIENKYYEAPGYSFTELFDIIDLTHLEECSRRNDSLLDFKKKTPSSLKEIQAAKTVNYDDILSVVNKNSIKAKSNSTVAKQSLSRYKSTYEYFLKSCRDWCNQNLKDANQLSDIDCIKRFMDIAINNGKLEINRNTIKRYVSMIFSPMYQSESMRIFLNNIKKKNIPILTTNYDHLMSSALGLNKYRLPGKFTAFYPWNVYFSDKELANPSVGFGIWHINGMVDYIQSIKIGLSDYMGNVERAREMIQGDYFSDFFVGKDQQKWSGYYSWMHILFNKDLFIFGLSLDENEVFLRWLLLQRAKYAIIKNRTIKGWFFDTKISIGKKFFLEKLGIEAHEISHDELYNALSDI